MTTETITINLRNHNTKTAGYKEGVAYVASVFSTVDEPRNLPTALLIMVADVFQRPIEKVLVDVSRVLVR